MLKVHADVFPALRAMVDEDVRISAQHNMQARLLTLAMEMLAAMPARERRAESLRTVHRGEEEFARSINTQRWPVRLMQGVGAIPERSRELLLAALDDEQARADLIAWLESFRPPGASDAPPGAGPPRPPRAPGPSSSRSPKGSGKRRRSS